MKFLCDNCKAKYQIADDKVAGKTVRMKCRKCGHQIEVRAAVTETSVSTSPPKASEAPRPPTKSSLATSLSATKPRPSAPSHGGALAGAFQRTVQDAPATVPFPGQADALELSVTDEWYVAINGVPVGPVRVSELRRKAASGAVTEDSLVWQEGLEEWRPVRSISELAALVREAAQGNRVSLVAPPPPAPRISQPPRAPQRPAPPRTSEPPRAPEPARPLAPSRSNVVPLHARVATAEKLDDAPAPLGEPTPAPIAPAPSLTPAPAAQAAPQPLGDFAAPAVAVADPFAVPPAPAAAASPLAPPVMSPIAATPSIAPAPAAVPSRRSGPPLWFYPIAFLALGFGVAGGVVVFMQSKQPAPVATQPPPSAAPTTPSATVASQDDVPPPPSAEPSASAAPTTTATAKPVVASNSKTAATPTSTAKQTADLSSLLNGAGGPTSGPNGHGGGAGGGGLDSAAVQRVVRDRQAGVKRTCWERGGGEGKSSANVTVTVTVAPNGAVSGASASGDDPVVAKCIENQVRNWSFPAPGSTTKVNIPFHFVRQ